MALYLPRRYASLQEENRGIYLFAGRELEAIDRIHRHVARGGLAVLQGPWIKVTGLHDAMRRRCRDGVELRRLMLRAEGDLCPNVDPPQHVPHLSMLLGEPSAPPSCLVALEDLLTALAAMQTLHPVAALGGDLIVHDNVLVPRSQPLITLMKQAMEGVRDELPTAPAALDMGCGSGVCSLLAATLFPDSTVTATDHLPEAAATTHINTDRFVAAGLIRPGAVTIAAPGDLFETLGTQSYDLIIFNAPWVAAPALNRAETALNDAGQQTVRRFLLGAAQRLNNGGRIILGYADHSGPKAMANLERFIAETGLVIKQRHADRIKTHRQNRPWQAIYAYELARA